MCPRYRMTGEKYRHFQGKCIPIPGLSAISSQDVTQLMVSGGNRAAIMAAPL